MEKKKLTKLELYWYMIGGAIGSGLFVSLPFAIGYAGKAASLAVVVGAAIAMLAYMYIVVISSFFPLSGGEYSQVAFITPPVLAGAYGYMWLLGSLTLTAYATGCVDYASAFFPEVANYKIPISLAIITFFFVINYFGTKKGAKIQGVMTIVLIISLTLFTVMGLPKVNWSTFLTDGDFFMNGFSGFSAAVGMTVYVTLGPTFTAASLASEVDDPIKTVPRSGIGGQLFVTAICTLIVIAACGVLPIEQVANKSLTVVASAIFPKPIRIFFTFGGAIFALLTSLMSSVTTFRYPFLQLADEGWLPSVFKKKLKNGYPYVAMIAMYVLTMIPLLFDISFDTIISYTSVPGYIVIIFVDRICITLPKKYPKQWERSIFHMPMPLYYLLCALGMAASLYLTFCYIVEMQMIDIVISFALTGVMIFAAWFCIKTKRVSPEYLQKQKDDIIREIEEYEKTQA